MKAIIVPFKRQERFKVDKFRRENMANHLLELAAMAEDGEIIDINVITVYSDGDTGGFHSTDIINPEKLLKASEKNKRSIIKILQEED